jgi:phosphatidylglycerophosphate synthase
MSMTTATPARNVPRPRIAQPPWYGRDLGIGALPLVAVSAATCWLVGLPTSHLLQSGALYAVLAALVLRYLPPIVPGPGIGPANRVTLGRAALVLPVGALALQAGPLSPVGYWWVIALATVAMILDGVDGRVARRTGSASPFGARFDMELDAFLLMALSVLVWRSGRAGVWVLGIGGLRYLFVLAGHLWPALRGELPPSLRRKTVCVVQGVSLLVCLAPLNGPGATMLIAQSAFALLVYSFAVDVRWLAGQNLPDSRALAQ